jgi:hypothetical protein
MLDSQFKQFLAGTHMVPETSGSPKTIPQQSVQTG